MENPIDRAKREKGADRERERERERDMSGRNDKKDKEEGGEKLV